eukprot:4019876-Amphidinium_carterae.1
MSRPCFSKPYPPAFDPDATRSVVLAGVLAAQKEAVAIPSAVTLPLLEPACWVTTPSYDVPRYLQTRFIRKCFSRLTLQNYIATPRNLEGKATILHFFPRGHQDTQHLAN